VSAGFIERGQLESGAHNRCMFGFELWQALIIIVLGAILVYWLLTQMAKRG
jgi:hypothetical protein